MVEPESRASVETGPLQSLALHWPLQSLALHWRIVVALGAYALVGGFVSLLGWGGDIRRLTDWFDNGISIQPNTALAATCSGAALILLSRGRQGVSTVLGGLVALIGGGSLLQYITGVNFESFNTLLMFEREWGRMGVTEPGRLGPPSSVCWTLLGFVLMFASSGAGSRFRRAVSAIALVTLSIAALSIIGYGYGADPLYSRPYLTAIAFQTATFVVAVSAGGIAAVPETPPMRWLLHPGATGAVARRSLPFIVVVPPVVGWLALQGELSGLYDAHFEIAIMVLALMGLLVAFLSSSLVTIARHERRLRKSERRVVDTLESVTDGFVAIDRDWRYVIVNEEATKILQKNREELLGRRVWELFPDSVDGISHRELHRAAVERISVEYEEFVPVVQRWFVSRAYPTQDGGLAVYFRDVTERKRVAQLREADIAALTRLQALSTQLVPAGDLSALLREILSAATDLTGTRKGNIQLYDPVSERLRIAVQQGFGRRFLERFGEQGSALVCDLAARRIERVIWEDLTQEPALQGTEDLAVILEEGVRAIQATPLVSRDGRILGLLNSHFDAPHRPSEQELRYLDLLARMAADLIERSRAENALRDADRRKDEFLAMLAHELRNPLAPMRNAVHILRLEGSDGEVVRTAADMMDRQVSQMVRLVDDLLDVSRITRGRIDLRKERVELSTALRQAVEDTRALADSMGHGLEVAYPSEAIHLSADPARLNQVIGNLLSNACKFTSQGGRIRLAVERDEEHAVVRVRDNGVGIAADQLPHIFDMFVQVDTSLERSAGGLGIGLTLVKSLVEMHGGSVAVHSDGPGRGSEFVLRLPILHEEQGFAGAAASATRVGAPD